MSLLGFKLRLGMFPSAKKIDKQHDALVREYQEYLEYSKSKELARFEYLNKYLNSSEFEERENNPEVDRAEIENIKNEFKRLQKSPQLTTYFKSKSREARFIYLRKWKLIFEDHFDSDKLDSKKWITRHFWGDKLLNNSYSLPDDVHCNTDGKNISLADSILSIQTKKENVNGFSWNPSSGFIFRQFQYTSGVINTGNAFRSKYGKLEAKIKVPKGKAYHALWLAGERMLPQINVFKYAKKKFHLGYFWGNTFFPNGANEDQTTVSGAFAGRYCIFSIEWTPKQLIWSINGKEFKTAHRNIPSEPMYIAFASGVENGAKLSSPVKLEIDWVRFYTKV